MNDNMLEYLASDTDQLTLTVIENTMQAAGYSEPTYSYAFNYEYKTMARDELLIHLAYFAFDGTVPHTEYVQQAADFIGWKHEVGTWGRWFIDDPRLRTRRSSGQRRCIVDYYHGD